MKAILIWLFLLISANTAFSQQQVEDYTDKLGGEVWLLDSVHYYEGSVNVNLFLKQRDIITSRNSRGDIISGLVLSRKSEADIWEKKSRFTQTYYDNAQKKEYKFEIYDTGKNIWIDSIRYKRYNNLGLLIEDHILNYNKDLGIYAFGSKVYKSYNSDDKLTENKNLTWDKNKQEWVNNKLELFDYTVNGYKKKSVSKIWSKGTNTWVNTEKKEWKYNSDNAIVEYKTLKWVSNTWVNNSKRTFDYTSEGKSKMLLRQKWNASENSWENVLKFTYEYEGDSMISVLEQKWITNDDEWKDITLEVKKYNDDNLLIDNFKYYYSLVSEGKTGLRFLYYYDADKKVSSKLKKKWNQENSVWVNQGKWEYEYNSEITTVFSNWDEDKMEWVYDYYYKYVLDTKDRTIFSIKKVWNIEDNIWVNDFKYEKEYDDYNHLVNNNYYVWLNNSWIFISKKHYFWSKYDVDNIEEYPEDDFIIFPNPAVDVLNLSYDLSINFENLKIYSLSGEKVLEISRPYYDKIDISQLINGVYVLRINTDRGIVSKLFSVEK